MEQEKKLFYLISLKHTSKADTALTFWGADGSGYCWGKDRAGVYDEEGVKKHCSSSMPDTVPIPKEEVDKWWREANDFQDRYTAVPNNQDVQYALRLNVSLMKPKMYATCRMIFLTQKPDNHA
jgi:hypothetical protein